MRRISLALALLSSLIAVHAAARAPDTFEEDHYDPVIIDSPMWLAFELKVGPYNPGNDSWRKAAYGDDRGWLLALELDATIYHIPYVGQLGAGFGWGWANYDGETSVASTGNSSGEETELILYPLSALAILRVDALARYTVLPITFAGKVGYDWVRYKFETEDRTDKAGFNRGLRWGAQAAIELDFFDNQSARRMDEDFGINHTFVLFEYYESKTKGTGDRSFQFGLGIQF